MLRKGQVEPRTERSSGSEYLCHPLPCAGQWREGGGREEGGRREGGGIGRREVGGRREEGGGRKEDGGRRVGKGRRQGRKENMNNSRCTVSSLFPPSRKPHQNVHTHSSALEQT